MANIKDAQKYGEYAKRAGPANAKHGSKFLVRGGKKTTLEGDIPFERIVVSEFPDVETAKKFYHSPEYQEARKHRLGAADFHMVIVEGPDSLSVLEPVGHRQSLAGQKGAVEELRLVARTRVGEDRHHGVPGAEVAR